MVDEDPALVGYAAYVHDRIQLILMAEQLGHLTPNRHLLPSLF